MAPRRRDRRPLANAAHPDPVPVQPQPVGAYSSATYKFALPSFFVTLLVLAVYYRHATDSGPAVSGPVVSVRERGLVKSQVTSHEILSEHGKVSVNTSHENFPFPVLAYVTPWNSLGYEMAEKFSFKLSHISPVWYELKSEGGKLVLEGRHNADVGWISRLRANGQSLVLPRFVLEALPSEFLLKRKNRNNVVNLIMNECKEMGYDGIVLESWSRWAAYGVLHDSGTRSMALQFIKQLGEALHSVNSAAFSHHHLELIYVIPAPRSQDLKEHDFGPEDLQQLNDSVDGFSLMTYDFSGPQSPGPNAPLNWIRLCLKLLLGDIGTHEVSLARKIFLGINFYGNDFILAEGPGGGAITGRDYISLLERHRPTVQWEEKSAEHFSIYSENNIKHAVFYPSLMSISTRLDEARAWGVSLSIWEIGQGLSYFFDIL